MRRADEQMHREGGQQCEVNLRRLIQLVPRWHHHENVHIAIGVRLAIGVRAKQNDLVRLKLFSHLPRKSLDDT